MQADQEYSVIGKPPSIFDDYVMEMESNGSSVQLALQEMTLDFFQRSLHNAHPIKADVILFTFSIANVEALQTISSLVCQEKSSSTLPAPCMLVGLKKDIRVMAEATDGSREMLGQFVSSKQGALAAESMGARYYIECSSASGEGVQHVFMGATELAFAEADEAPGRGRLAKVAQRISCLR
ncbi:ras family domain-containing protein [Cordyceps javanica]|uniref:Ras family domain-containing protein n=1 Tax=Cordyceps javanica TaxID=43265 RepID=A0A545VJJ1_9HYPO|nr:ras family domain-containing protein [Cordyceps javanica]TQW01875.1 ras family domain-containing protein [Cordyceps javanica]